jgi:integrase
MQFRYPRREAERLATALDLRDLDDDERLAVIEEYRRRSEAAFARSTVRTLKQIIKSFRAWCRERGYPPDPPVPPHVVAEYVDALAGHVKANTIETRLWAIGEYHKSHLCPSPAGHRLVVLALKAVKRAHGAATKQAAPLQKREVIDALGRLGNSRIELRDKALLWTASDTWCRASELVAFRVSDVFANGDGSSSLCIRRSKTDVDGRGEYAYLSRRGTLAVHEWIETAGLSGEDPIFTKSQRGGRKTPLDTATVSRIFKKRTGRADVSTHSTRVGGVHDALSLGCDLTAVMISGRWTSPEMPARYGRLILTTRSAAARVAEAHEE